MKLDPIQCRHIAKDKFKEFIVKGDYFCADTWNSPDSKYYVTLFINKTNAADIITIWVDRGAGRITLGTAASDKIFNEAQALASVHFKDTTFSERIYNYNLESIQIGTSNRYIVAIFHGDIALWPTVGFWVDLKFGKIVKISTDFM